MQILLVEDEVSLAHGIKLNLEFEGYNVDHLNSGKEVVSATESNFYDLIILDIMLPEINGFDIAETIRKKSNVPIMFISAKNQSTDRIKGLKIGADDYLSKPFELEELLLRVKNLLSRKNDFTVEIITINNYKVDFKGHTAETALGDKKLSKKEVEILRLLNENAGKVVSREEILQKVWKNEADASSRTIDNFIVNFRKYFEEQPREPQHFISVRGVGYIFTKKTQ